MNCTGNCNQGRNCSCAPAMPSDGPLWILMAFMLSLAIFCVGMLEFAATGSTIHTLLAIGIGVGLWLAVMAGMWAADKLIDAIDWMTRFEKRRHK